MKDERVERLFELLDVRLDAFAMCEIENGCSLACAPSGMIVVHFVLEGRGAIHWAGGTLALEPGMVVVVPRNLPKQIAGAGPVVRSVPADAASPLPGRLVRYRASHRDEARADLILGCASMDATVGEKLGLFDALRAPLAEQSEGDRLRRLFEAMLGDLADPGLGSKAMVGATMKQVVILLLRAHFARLGDASPLGIPLMHPRLGRALLLILEQPEGPHSLGSLAAAAGMSRSRFVHHFNAVYGRTPMEFVQLVRLQAAARMLRSSQLPVKAVAAAVGYASRSHFSHAFRTEYGVDPTGFRSLDLAGIGRAAVAADA